mmetsp:Transcript_13275/g.41018  ORF Transcript_13275/g.41018 Transcript_13275/m.41018 type:complete len:111 (-) Transcript_13275:81-413(-)
MPAFTPLGLACYQGRVNDARRILDDGADIDLENDDGRTALYCTCQQGHVAMVRLCLERGGDVNALHVIPHMDQRRTPQIIAESDGHGALAAWLAKIGEGRATFRCPATSW